MSSRLDRVFFALSDSTRRSLIDRLHRQDGQRTGQLAEDFTISRQAISKHLEVLEEAALLVSRRGAGETRYFLNRVPMREVQLTWFGKYTRVEPRVDCA